MEHEVIERAEYASVIRGSEADILHFLVFFVCKLLIYCESACNNDPPFGIIGVQN
jgi:hypothetical protein